MGVLVEKFHDDKGIIWPQAVAPFQVHLVGLKDATQVYDQLIKAGIKVLYDDTDRSAGEKFADADLIGIPVRLIVSEKSGEKVEWKRRDSEEVELIEVEEAIQRVLR